MAYVFGVIPARAGSKGLPGKNLMTVGALSLLGHAIASARESRLLSRFIVSTEDPALAAEARRHGAEVPFVRPEALASDEAGMVPVLQHAVRWLEATGTRIDLVVTLQPTSPFRTGADIDRTIAKVLDTGSDSAQTVTAPSYHPFFMMTVEGDRAAPLFPDGARYVRRQDAPSVYQPSGAVYVTRRAVLMADEGRVLGADNRVVPMGFEASVNVNTVWDFRLAEAIFHAGQVALPPGRG